MCHISDFGRCGHFAGFDIEVTQLGILGGDRTILTLTDFAFHGELGCSPHRFRSSRSGRVEVAFGERTQKSRNPKGVHAVTNGNGQVSVRALSVGPIVGYTTYRSVRLWGRGKHKKNEWCWGVARLKKKNEKNFQATKVFKMKRHFDYTAVVDFDELLPGTAYDFQFGYVTTAQDLAAAPKSTNLKWTSASVGCVQTAPENDRDQISLIFGSCRYILSVWGGAIWDERGDKVYRSINRQIDGYTEQSAWKDEDRNTDPIPTDLVLMVGDQIYADDLNFVSPDDSLEDYLKRYRLTFSQDHVRRLMSRLPTYMMLDDHEIEDNWTQDRVSEKGGKFGSAMHAYQSYQMIHGPAYEPELGQVNKIWYSFRHGSADFFVLDTRTERFIENRTPRIIGDRQMRALLAWLLTPTNTIKFVVSSVPMFPDGRTRSKDKWSGFEAQRLQVLDFIRDHAIKRVVFLSGDVHCSMTSVLGCSTHSDFKVHSIISSSFFWPYPQGQDSDFDLTGVLSRSGESRYEITKTSDVISSDNFTRVTGDSKGICVEVYDRKGYKKDCQEYSF